MIFKNLNDFQNTMFNLFIALSYILYAGIVFGLSTNAPIYLDTLDYYIKIYISLFLLWRFNPFRTITFTELDRKIVFSAGLFVFATTAVNGWIKSYLSNITKQISTQI